MQKINEEGAKLFPLPEKSGLVLSRRGSDFRFCHGKGIHMDWRLAAGHRTGCETALMRTADTLRGLSRHLLEPNEKLASTAVV